MGKKNFRIDFVELESGNVPFERFLDNLNTIEKLKYFQCLML